MDSATREKKILIINSTDYVGKELASYITKLNLPGFLYLVNKTTDKDSLRQFESNPKIKILDYRLFFKSDLANENFDAVIYNAISENGTSSELIDFLSNFKLLIQKITYSKIPLTVLVPINSEAKSGKKIDYS